MYQSSMKFGPKYTPKPIKVIIIITAVLSILSAVIHPSSWTITPNFLLSLSLTGFKHYFLWQLITYLFIVPSRDLSFSFLLHLAFNLYLMWFIGSAIIEQKGEKKFLFLYFIGGIISAFIALLIMHLGYPFYIMGGNSIGLYICMIAWIMLFPDLKLLLLFAIPVVTKWLIPGIIAINLLVDLSNRDFVNFTSYLFASFFGYFYTLINWKVMSPFPFLRKFEEKIIYSKILQKRKKIKKFFKSKVYDFKSGEPIVDNDEIFLNEMLEKISKHGEDSLTKKEKKKLKKISDKKKNK